MSYLKSLSATWDAPTKASLAVFSLLLVCYCALNASGLVVHEGGLVTPLFVTAFLAMIVALAYRPRLCERFKPQLAHAKPLVCIALVFIAYFLLERPYNAAFLDIPLHFALLNLCIIGVLFCLVYFAAQQTKTAAIAFLAVCFIAGTANYFVISFKGQPILPADLFALETAASVSGGYTYAISDGVAIAFLALAFGTLLVLFLPKTAFAAKRSVANVGAALACVLAFGFWFTSFDLEEAYGVEVDVWSSQESYAQKGSLLCFLKRAQDLTPSSPDGYGPEAVQEILGAYPMPDEPLDPEALERPAIVAIMNETFSDLSLYPNLADAYVGTGYFDSIDDAVWKGDAYASALGGGTCNSEFEFLTGSTMGSLGGGVYPYVLYELDGTENLASYLGALGYDTTAIHPAEAVNWRRDKIYQQLGFDEFLDISSFEGAETLRDLPTDRETYQIILDRLAENDDPQFIFDVTIQNHGGYDTGLIPDEMAISAPIDGVAYPELDEYISTIQQANLDLEYLIEGLSALDRPVVLCFFGDHQPGFSDWLSSLAFGKDVDDFDLTEVQARYTVPYMIWANYDQGELVPVTPSPDSDLDALEAPLYAPSSNLSLNYLASRVLSIAGLPLSPYQQFLLDIQRQLPAVNLNGYLDDQGTWRWINEESSAAEAFDAYAIVQHDNLFGDSEESSFAHFASLFSGDGKDHASS